MVEVIVESTLKTHGMGSLTNVLDARGKDPEPKVGMGATRLMFTDRDAWTVIEVVMGKKGIHHLVLQEDALKRTDDNGLSESQSYEFTPDPNGLKIVVKFHAKSGKWREVQANISGTPIEEVAKLRVNAKGNIVKLGRRDAYHDPSF